MRRVLVLALPLASLALLAATAVADSEYRVQRGDTLWEIAEDHGVPLEALKRANDLDSDVIHPGQVLRIPTDEDDGTPGLAGVIGSRVGDGDGSEPSSRSEASETVRTAAVGARALNVRAGPGTEHRAVDLVQRGQRVQLLRRRGAWRKVRWEGGTGWVYGDHLEDERTVSVGGGEDGGERRARSVSASVLNVRAGPSTSDLVTGRVERGDEVEVVGERGPWRRLARGGWVHGAYLQGTGVSRAGFVQLPDEGPGFYGYYDADRRWGTPELIEGLKRVARRFKERHPDGPRLGFGDISLRNGGDISGHASHERGVDVDMTPLRNDGREARRTGLGHLGYWDPAYSRELTQELIDLLREELPVTHIFFNDRRTEHTQRWPNHDAHLHVRIRR